MKKIFFFMVLLGIAWKGIAQEGVNFESLNFGEALAKAKAEKKYLFVDCYTAWCGPCKRMTQDVFPQKKVGDYFKVKFVCVKYDMEKGEGPELAERFKVKAYPTFLVLDATGELLHKIVGAYGAEEIVERVEESFDPEKAYGSIKKRYDAGDRETNFLQRYLKLLIRYYDPDAERVAAELLNTLSDKEKVNDSYWFIFSDSKLTPDGSENEAWLLKNYNRFYKTIGKEKVKEELDRRYTEKLLKILSDKDRRMDDKQISALGREIAAVKLSTDEELQVYVRLVKVLLKGDVGQLVSVCEEEFPKLKTKEIPYIQFCDWVLTDASAEERERYIALGEKMYAQVTDEKAKNAFKFVLDYLKQYQK